MINSRKMLSITETPHYQAQIAKLRNQVESILGVNCLLLCNKGNAESHTIFFSSNQANIDARKIQILLKDYAYPTLIRKNSEVIFVVDGPLKSITAQLDKYTPASLLDRCCGFIANNFTFFKDKTNILPEDLKERLEENYNFSLNK